MQINPTKKTTQTNLTFFVVTPSCQKVEYYCSSPAEIEPDQYLYDTETELGEILSTLYLLNCDGDV